MFGFNKKFQQEKAPENCADMAEESQRPEYNVKDARVILGPRGSFDDSLREGRIIPTLGAGWKDIDVIGIDLTFDDKFAPKLVLRNRFAKDPTFGFKPGESFDVAITLRHKDLGPYFGVIKDAKFSHACILSLGSPYDIASETQPGVIRSFVRIVGKKFVDFQSVVRARLPEQKPSKRRGPSGKGKKTI